jgi:hypothetical protein
MKLRLIFVVGLFVAALLSCEAIRKQSTVSGHNAVKIDEHSVLIPGTTISAEDQNAVTKIFRKYDSSLYRIAVYENGSLKKKIGKMDEMQIGAIAGEYTNNAKASGLTNWTMQIGRSTHVTTTGSPTHITTAGSPTHVTTTGSSTHVTTTGSPTHVTTHGSSTHITKISPESDALVKEVTPILEKYSK